MTAQNGCRGAGADEQLDRLRRTPIYKDGVKDKRKRQQEAMLIFAVKIGFCLVGPK